MGVIQECCMLLSGQTQQFNIASSESSPKIDSISLKHSSITGSSYRTESPCSTIHLPGLPTRAYVHIAPSHHQESRPWLPEDSQINRCVWSPKPQSQANMQSEINFKFLLKDSTKTILNPKTMKCCSKVWDPFHPLWHLLQALHG